MTKISRVRQFLFVSTLALAGAAAAAGLSPDAQVKATTEEVLQAITQTSGGADLERVAETRVAPHFDFRRMTQSALGPSWRRANAEQQEALTAEFSRLLIRTYARVLAADRTAEARVAVAPTGDEGADETLVRTTVTRPGRRPVAIDYRMARSTAGWKVTDVTVESVSLVASYRDSFAATVNRNGIDGLIRSLAEKNRSRAAAG